MENQVQQPQTAQYLRLPRAGSRDPIFGLSRSTWNNLILQTVANRHQPPIKSFSLKKGGAIRGTRLIVLESCYAFFNKLENEQNPAGPEMYQAQFSNFDTARINCSGQNKSVGNRPVQKNVSEPTENRAA